MNQPENENIAMRKWLSTAHMAHKFGVVPSTINRWTREGKLPKPITLAGKGHHRFWLVEEVEAWEEKKLDDRA